jgi:hypothetical protein
MAKIYHVRLKGKELCLNLGPRLRGVKPLRMPLCRSLRHVDRCEE